MAGGESRIELLQGTLDFIILQTLRWQPQHGFGLAQMIRAHSNDTLQVDTGSLYPALHRLERAKLIDATCERFLARLDDASVLAVRLTRDS